MLNKQLDSFQKRIHLTNSLCAFTVMHPLLPDGRIVVAVQDIDPPRAIHSAWEGKNWDQQLVPKPPSRHIALRDFRESCEIRVCGIFGTFDMKRVYPWHKWYRMYTANEAHVDLGTCFGPTIKTTPGKKNLVYRLLDLFPLTGEAYAYPLDLNFPIVLDPDDANISCRS